MSDDSELRKAMEISAKSAELAAAAASATAASIKKFLESYNKKETPLAPVKMIKRETPFLPVRMVRRQIYKEVLRNTEKAHASIKKYLDEVSSPPPAGPVIRKRKS